MNHRKPLIFSNADPRYTKVLSFCMPDFSASWQRFRNSFEPMPRRLGPEGRSSTQGPQGDNIGTAEGRQKDTGSICLDMSRYEPGQTICYPVRISQSYIYRLAGAPVRLKYAQISLQKIVKQRQLPVLCQKKTSALIHYDTQLGSSTEPQLQGFGLEVLRPSPAQADPNLKTACSEFPACEESPRLLANQSSRDGTSAFSSYVYDSYDLVEQIPTSTSQKDLKGKELNLAFTLCHMHREGFAESLTLLWQVRHCC